MEDLDSALNELGMLSSSSKFKLDYLKVSPYDWCTLWCDALDFKNPLCS